MDNYSFLNTAHTAYFADLYDQYLQDPDKVEPSWRAFFQGFDFGLESNGVDELIASNETKNVEIPEHLQKEFKVVKWCLEDLLISSSFSNFSTALENFNFGIFSP